MEHENLVAADDATTAESNELSEDTTDFLDEQANLQSVNFEETIGETFFEDQNKDNAFRSAGNMETCKIKNGGDDPFLYGFYEGY